MPESIFHYLTFRGIPLRLRLQFPFHPSAGGADYHVLHGNAALEDESGLYAEVSVHMSQVVKESLSSRTEAETVAATINAIRKTTDTHDIEFLKSTKKQPVHLSSRMFSLVTSQFTFQKASDDQLVEFLRAKAYWSRKREEPAFELLDPVEQMYLNATPERLAAAGAKLVSAGSLSIDGDRATATDSLFANGAEFEARMSKALDELNAKHAYERETQKA